MNDNKDIEKMIVENFTAHEVDLEQRWLDDMDSRLDAFNEKRRRKIFVLWFFTIGLVLTGTMFYLQSTYNSHSPNSTRIANHDSKKEEFKSHQPIVDSIITPNDLDKANAEKLNETPLKSNGSNVSASTDKSIPLNSTKNKKEPTFNLKIQEQEETKSLALIKEQARSTYYKPTHQGMREKQKQEKIIILQSDDTRKGIKTSSPIYQIGERDSTVDFLPLNTPAYFSLASLYRKDLHGQSFSPEKPDLSKWTLGLLIGPSLTDRSFQSLENNSYSIARKTSEKGRLNWDVDVELSRKFNRFNLATGIGVSSVGENVNYEPIENTSVAVDTVITDASYWHIDSTFIQGQWVYASTWVVDADTMQQYNYTYSSDSTVLAANGKTQFSYIEVPVKFGFTLLENEKIEISTMIGISIGYRVLQKGNYLMNGGGITAAQSKNVSFNSMYELDFKYHLNKTLSLGVRPRFKMNHVNNSNLTGTRRKYNSWGVRVACFFNL